MTLTLVTAPTGVPIGVDEAVEQCRVELEEEIALFSALVLAATDYVESFTHRALCTQTWDLKLDWGFPADDVIWLPKPPLQTTVAPVVTYVDSNGVTQTVSASLYTVDAPAGPHARMGRIVPAYGQVWPATRSEINAVRVRFSCGYGTGASVPSGIKVAMKALVAHWWTNRSATSIGPSVSEVPLGVTALLWPFKAF